MSELKTWLSAKRGRVTELAAACGVTHSAVLQWDKVPAAQVLAVEAATGISRHDLRQDVFGPAPEQAA